jgi:hypothetical protein
MYLHTRIPHEILIFLVIECPNKLILGKQVRDALSNREWCQLSQSI